ncbi:MAG: mandelate racemase/muconate lactonizing enzyme family protein [Chloroflexaceae bacterium]|nr:mandelate racemase/muconate lactonizing enzyme family protein [Chloroflexaceae bacterium]
MKITHIETLLHKDKVAAVRLRTDDGHEGLGQTACHGADLSVAALHKLIAPLFLGANPWDVGALVDRAMRDNYKYNGTIKCRALCGVETAVWDLLGKLTGQPVYRLLGGAVRERVPMYASSLSRKITPEQEAERMAEAVRTHGFRCVKIKIGGRMSRDADAWPGRTEQIIPLMREALGPDVDISADANSSYSPSKAIQVGRMLERHGYFHFEEPCPFDEPENTKLVADALDIPVAGGEQDWDVRALKRMIDSRTVDIVQLDIGYLGGISRARRVAELADLSGVVCTPHCANHSMLQVFSLHLAVAMPACAHYQEYRIDNDVPWAESIYTPMPQVVDGALPLPSAPGWGVELQPAFVRTAELRSSTL